MELIQYENGRYRSAPRKIPLCARLFPSLSLYSRFIHTVIWSSRRAKQGVWSPDVWIESSLRCLHAIEHAGVSVEITGIEHLKELKTPAVIVGNHMSVAETVVLPGIIQPVRDVTFIVKQSLLEYPVFKHIMRAVEPIAVTRDNPRHDLRHVLQEGLDRLERGISLVVFPQTTRMDYLDAERFSTLGVKLARKAGVPVIPVAIDTRAWGNGKLLKDFGKIDISKDMHFAFGPVLAGDERDEVKQQQIVEFIREKLAAWRPETPAARD